MRHENNKEIEHNKKQEKQEEEPPLYYYRTIQLFIINVGVYIITSILGHSFLITSDYVLVILGVSKLSLYPLFWWQFITAMFTHASISHLLGNMIFLLFFGLKGEEIGLRNEIVKAYLLSGLVGNIISAIILPEYTVSVGASGAVFGLMAFVIVELENKQLMKKKTALFLILIFFVLSGGSAGSNIQVNVISHFFGAVTGFLYGKYDLKKKAEKLSAKKIKK